MDNIADGVRSAVELMQITVFGRNVAIFDKGCYKRWNANGLVPWPSFVHSWSFKRIHPGTHSSRAASLNGGKSVINFVAVVTKATAQR